MRIFENTFCKVINLFCLVDKWSMRGWRIILLKFCLWDGYLI